MDKIKRIARQFWQASLFLLLTTAFLFLSMLPSALAKRYFPLLYQRWSACFFGIFGIAENIHPMNTYPIPEKFILISNHPSGIELVWLPARFKVIPLAKAEIRDWFLLGRIIQAIGAVFVDRKDRASRQGAAKGLFQAVEAGKNPLIFPEGGCYGKDLNPFFKGAFHLAKQTGRPILPVYLHYEEEDSYEWGDYGLLKFMRRALFIPHNRNAHLYIFDPVNPDSFETEEQLQEHLYSFYLQQQSIYRKKNATA